jgi:BirA family biotin operon repressor/biotin-[acetyl-CoA-carboxylase] ligase
MDVAVEAAASGAAEGLVIVADEQTQGRGRRVRAWSSPPGAGLYLSFMLRPASTPAVLSLITLAAGVAVRTAIEDASGFVPELKWPNDVMVDRRKLGGILAEGLNVGTPSQIVILGIGVNILVASHPGHLAARATSLEAELGRRVGVAQIYDRLRVGHADAILREWRQAAPSAKGAQVEWQASDGPRRGTTAGIDQTGALLVQTEAGIERVVGGELTWL